MSNWAVGVKSHMKLPQLRIEGVFAIGQGLHEVAEGGSLSSANQVMAADNKDEWRMLDPKRRKKITSCHSERIIDRKRQVVFEE